MNLLANTTQPPMLYQPRWYQEEAIESIFEYFATKQGNPVIAMPTGTGKSIVIAEFIRRVMQRWPGQRFIVATHVKELIEQNAAKLAAIWPHAPYGIHSAGLKQRDKMQPIIFGGIASMYKMPEVFGHRDILLIDECHLLNPKDGTMYLAFIRGLLAINPKLKVIGLSATIYRMGQGLITDGGLFTDVCYDLTTLAAFARLIREGWLSMLIPKKTTTVIDTSQLHISSTGDYVQSELETAAERITLPAIQEAMTYAQGRHSWLVFCSGVRHAVKTAEILNHFGIRATAVHSQTKDFKLDGEERTRRFEAWKAGDYRAITNNNVLTTGVDHPPVDMILMLRATLSTSLWVQMLGRGTRPFAGDNNFPEKHNCMVLDYGGNTRRLGPINDPVIPKKKGAGGGDAPVKICDYCGTFNHISARVCIGCGEEFEIASKIERKADTAALIRGENDEPEAAITPDIPVIETLNVERVYYFRHQNKSKPLPSLRVDYHLSDHILPITEYVNLEHMGLGGKHARDWWRSRHASEPPKTIAEALAQVSNLRVPARIRVNLKPKWPQILGYEYD
jgi:DNA repair protein RadD